MTASELQQYCEWVQSQNVHNKAHIQEASFVQHKEPHTAYATAAYIPKAIPDLITYLHAAAGYPVKKTWIRAIQQRHFVGWPGLTADRVHKSLNVNDHSDLQPARPGLAHRNQGLFRRSRSFLVPTGVRRVL